MKTRKIEQAIKKLEEAEEWIFKRAMTTQDYKMTIAMREVAQDAREELNNLSPPEVDEWDQPGFKFE